MSNRTIKLWDWPVRLCHWGLVLCVLACYGTAEWGWLSMQWHFYFGYTALTLVFFRVLWGFVGSEHARFTNFIRGPKTIWQYLQGSYQHGLGHNPIGALSTVALLLAVFVQAFTGLFNTDDIEWFGPLSEKVSSVWQERMADIHERFYLVLIALIGIHLIAILYYVGLKKQGLLRPMITGRKVLSANEQNLAHIQNWQDERQKPWWLALVLVALSAAAVYWLIS